MNEFIRSGGRHPRSIKNTNHGNNIKNTSKEIHS